jgi:hypothetical protein
VKFVLEQVIQGMDLESNDGGWNRSAVLWQPSVPLVVEIHSSYPDNEGPPGGGDHVLLEHHAELYSLVGKRVRVTIEVVEDP